MRKHKSGTQVGNIHGQSPRRRKALESETQERWRLKKAFKKAVSVSREEGSQTLNAELPEDRVKSLWTRDPPILGKKSAAAFADAEGSSSLREVPLDLGG